MEMKDFVGMNAAEMETAMNADSRWKFCKHTDAEGNMVCAGAYDLKTDTAYDLYFGGWGEGHFDEPLRYYEDF